MKTICIDPGHGGYDPGAQSNGLLEKDINLEIAKRVKARLAAYPEAIAVVMTREDDSAPGGLPDKNHELQARCDIANQAGADYFVSIHVNAAGGEGFESYVYEGVVDDATKALQDSVHGAMGAFYASHGCADRGKMQADYYVLHRTQMPALLVENLFIDNPQDAPLLTNGDVLDGVAEALVDGLLAVCGVEKKQPQEAPQEATQEAPQETQTGAADAQHVEASPDASAWQNELAEATAWAKDAGIVRDAFDASEVLTKAQLVVVLKRLHDRGGLQ